MNQTKLKYSVGILFLFLIITSILYYTCVRKDYEVADEGMQNIDTSKLMNKFSQQINLLNSKIEGMDKIDQAINSTNSI